MTDAQAATIYQRVFPGRLSRGAVEDLAPDVRAVVGARNLDAAVEVLRQKSYGLGAAGLMPDDRGWERAALAVVRRWRVAARRLP